ncbi:MAG: peptide MFS transporter [Phycisphaerae bacterium]|nr:peptide MFS transporter [Phycisphaerae bacterium]
MPSHTSGSGGQGGDNERTLLGHPPGLFLLFTVEMWERFSYYGMRGLLVLYMISVIAVHQLAPGTYSNTLKFEELGLDADKKPLVVATRSIPFHIVVGQQETASLEASVPSTGEPRVVMKRLRKESDAPDAAWIPDDAADTFGAVIVRGQPGAKAAFENRETRFRITNPTDTEIEGRFDVSPDPVDKRVYLTANGRQGASFSVKIKPDKDLKPGEKPLEIAVRTNDHDSGRNWSQSSASTLYGWYTGLAYLFPVIGGILADRFIGTHKSMILGGLIIALGHVVLAVSGLGDMAQNQLGMATFIGGLALIVLGTGHFKPCVSTMVGQLYKEGDPRRDGGFSIFYMGINLGAFICAFICGTLGEQVGWHWGFGSAAVGMIAGLVIYLIGRPTIMAHIGNPPAGRPQITLLLFVITCAVSAAFAFAFHEGWLGAVADGIQTLNQPEHQLLRNGLVFGGVFAVIVATGWFVAAQQPGDKGPTASIFLFMLFNAFFWIAFEQAGSSMNVFAEQNTSRSFLGFTIPATWFQSINAGLIFIFAPFFAWLWLALGRRKMNPTQPAKIGLGLVLLAAGFIFMVIGARDAASGALVSPIWLFLAYFLHTMGELCLSPTGLSYVTKAAPVRFVSLLMGIWFISSFIANLGGGLIAAKVEAIERGEIALPWKLGGQADFFMLFVVVPGGVGLLVLFATPLLKKLLRNQND